MRVLVAGATGFIGRALVPRLQRDGHAVVAWVRSDTRAISLLGADVDIVSAAAGQEALVAAMSGCDAVVNLAGEPLLGARWTDARRAILRASRIDVSRQLVEAMDAARPQPRAFVSASAVGFYGDRGDELLTESSSPRDDFLSRLCQDWEDAAASARGARVVRLRLGVVLGRGGGALAQMLPPFRIGAGGPIGFGRQYFPWIHRHDVAALIATALADDRYRGAINAVAPEIVTNRTFARALGAALRRPAILPTPRFVLRALFGEAAVVLFASQRVEPHAAAQLGFAWEFPSLDAALRDIVQGATVDVGKNTLRMTTPINATVDAAYAFFAKPANLNILTPAGRRLRRVEPLPSPEPGRNITYRWRLGPWPCTHVQVLTPSERGCVLEDHVHYNSAIIVRRLREIFKYRADIMRLRFGP